MTKPRRGRLRWIASLLLKICLCTQTQTRAVAQTTAGAPKQSESATVARIDWRTLRRSRHDASDKPTVQQTVQAALRYAKLRPGQARDRMARARWSSLLPEARVSARRGQSRDVFSESTGAWVPQSGDDDLTLEANLSFDLSRLVFASEETSLLREERMRAIEREQLIRQVTQLFYKRERFQILNQTKQKVTLDSYLEYKEAEAMLDGLTGGWYLRALRAFQAN